MALIQLSNIKKIPKSRALGSTLAANAGASYDDVISQVFWSSRGIFESYYQLSRMSQSNLTKIVKGNKNSEDT
ncbi:hypothetical protein AYI69_g199 [Smittium culicis]|uniref:Uncharacterized protein n=1 Tax=Smittium culicis TaxID=133412 RepID=A0A1R1YTP9_9FUNG|nr:hypothetical protein AYI69_g199 [Smittium culicis]